MSRISLGCRALACCAMLGGLALAQERPAESRREVQRTESKTTVHRASVVIGGTVSLREGYRVGKIEDFIFDDHGCISMVVVTYGEHYVAVPWSIATFDFGQRTFVLDIERDRLSDIPTFTDFKVAGTVDFRRRVDTFFGVRQRDGSDRPTPRPTEGDDTPRPKAKPGKQSPPKQPGTKTPDATDPAPPRPKATTPPRSNVPSDKQPGGKQPGGTQPRPKGSSDTPRPKPSAPPTPKQDS